MKKVAGEENPADLMTKNVNAVKVEKYMNLIQEEFKEGRAEVSIELK